MSDAVGKLLREEFDRAHKAAMDADKALEAHYRPQVEDCLAKGDVAGARILASRCGDSVGCVFLLDTIREWELKNR